MNCIYLKLKLELYVKRKYYDATFNFCVTFFTVLIFFYSVWTIFILAKTPHINQFPLMKTYESIKIYLKLAKNVDEDSPVKHWLAVHRRDQVGNFLFGGGVDIIVWEIYKINFRLWEKDFRL